jgi:molybdopterin-biosynthesis enzyme MoeA-like protein
MLGALIRDGDMGLGLYIIGDEILSGKRQDKHFSHVLGLLAARRMRLNWVQYLGDDPALLAAAFAASFGRGDVALSCGGIGATPDDHTRQSAAQALGVPLELHPQARELIQQRIRDAGLGDVDTAANRQRLQMGMFPQGSAIIPNPYNRIPGFSIRQHFFVPGFPVMAWPMLEWVLDGPLAHLHGLGHQVERAVIVRNALESDLTPLMEDIERRFAGIKVFSLPSVDHPVWGRHIELGVKGDASVVEQAFAYLREHLPPGVWEDAPISTDSHQTSA